MTKDERFAKKILARHEAEVRDNRANRITAAFGRMMEQIVQRVAAGVTTQEAVAESSEAMDISFDEYLMFQELKSLACIHGKLTTDEGMTVYAALGNAGPDKFNCQPVHVKAVLTSLFADLLKWKMSL